MSMSCRADCGACCVAPSLSSSIPGMEGGKPAGVRCIHLSSENRCRIYGDPGRPAVCSSFPAMEDHCGSSREEALRLLEALEQATGRPAGGAEGIP
jgi:Fe-S-cluster containining protein